MVKWYDPISEKWHNMPETVKATEIHDPVLFDPGAAVNTKRVWDAVVATSTSTTMADPTPVSEEWLLGLSPKNLTEDQKSDLEVYCTSTFAELSKSIEHDLTEFLKSVTLSTSVNFDA